MNKKLRKLLTFSSSVVMALSVGAGLNNIDVSAKQTKPTRKVRVVKKNKRHLSASKAGASLAYKFKVGETIESIGYDSVSKGGKYLYNHGLNLGSLEYKLMNTLIKNHINKSFLNSFYKNLDKDTHGIKSNEDYAFSVKGERKSIQNDVKRVQSYLNIHNSKRKAAYYDSEFTSNLHVDYKLRNNQTYKDEWIKLNIHDNKINKKAAEKIYKYYVEYGKSKAKHNTKFIKGWNAGEKILDNSDPFKLDMTKPYSHNSQYKAGWYARSRSAKLEFPDS